MEGIKPHLPFFCVVEGLLFLFSFSFTFFPSRLDPLGLETENVLVLLVDLLGFGLFSNMNLSWVCWCRMLAWPCLPQPLLSWACGADKSCSGVRGRQRLHMRGHVLAFIDFLVLVSLWFSFVAA